MRSTHVLECLGQLHGNQYVLFPRAYVWRSCTGYGLEKKTFFQCSYIVHICLWNKYAYAYIKIAIIIFHVYCARKGSTLVFASYHACFPVFSWGCSICHPTGSWTEASFHQALRQGSIAMLVASVDFREMEGP